MKREADYLSVSEKKKIRGKKMKKSDIFKSAWKSAKQAAERFGGSSKEYFAACLVQAWKESKMEKKETLPALIGSEKQVEWAEKVRATFVESATRILARANESFRKIEFAYEMKAIAELALEKIVKETDSAFYIHAAKMQYDLESAFSTRENAEEIDRRIALRKQN